MYTEVGEQMAEQNILNGNQKQLEQIIGDIKEHNVKKDRLEKLEESVKDISKELDNARKEKQNEMDSKIKASTDAICDGYDKSINADKDKIKAVSAARDKAKMVGVKERINAETASLRAQNEDLADQINEAFIHENISKVFNSQLFISVFNPKKLLDYVIDIAIILILSTPHLQKEISQKRQQPRSITEQEKLGYAQDCVNAFSNNEELSRQRAIEADLITKQRAQLGKKVIKERKSKVSELSGKPLDGMAEVHHKDRVADKPERAFDPTNLAVIRKDEHSEYHNSDYPQNEKGYEQFEKKYKK